MRMLEDQEINEVGGGLVGTQIPFTNGFIPGPAWPGGVPGAWTAIPVAFGTGLAIGGLINDFNMSLSGMSLGEAIYRTEQQLSDS